MQRLISIFIALALASCGSGSSAVVVVPVEHERWASLVPASFATTDSEIIFLDLAHAAAESGIAAPRDADDGIGAAQFATALLDTPLHAATSGMGEYDQPEVWRWKYGASLPEVELAVTARAAGLTFTMLRPFTPLTFDDLVAATKTDPDWGASITIREANGLPYIDWGDEIDLSKRSPGRPQGVGGFATIIDGWSVFTQHRDLIEELLAVANGEADSVLEDEGIRQVLSRLDTTDVESVVVLYSASLASPWQPPGMPGAAGYYNRGADRRSSIVYYGPEDFDAGLAPAEQLAGATVSVDGRSLTLTLVGQESFIDGAQCLGLGGCVE